jgi:DNA-binding beta-propeller fold protein YncE
MLHRIRKMPIVYLAVSVVVSTLLSSVVTAQSATTLPKPVYFQSTANELEVHFLGTYASKEKYGTSGTEIVVYHAKLQRGYSVNGASQAVDIFDLSVLKEKSAVVKELPLLKRLTVEELTDGKVTASGVTSVTIHPNGQFIAVAVPSAVKTDPGHVLFLNPDGELLSYVQVGALPDMLTFTPDGRYVLVANEGEPNDEYTINPEGSVSIIDLRAGAEKLTQANVRIARFTDEVIASDVRKFHDNVSYAQDLEPEYIAVNPNSKMAYVVLQEANAIAVIDIIAGKITSVNSLGYKNHAIAGNELDASDKDKKTNISSWPVLGMYMPDGMDIAVVNGRTYLFTANEGDSRDYDGFSEEKRVKDLKDNYTANVNQALMADEQLGRLKTTTVAPKNTEGKYDAIYAYGARSYSIWEVLKNGRLQLIFDSGSQMEKYTADANEKAAASLGGKWNTLFNSNDSRSDDKGPEPEGIVTGVVNGHRFTFVGLERTSGIYYQNVTNPAKPGAQGYFTTANLFASDSEGDISPEGMYFIPMEDSPNGMPLLLVAHEMSGTVAVYAFETSTYIVQPKDNLTKIAKKFGKTWKNLQDVNNLANPNLIYPGQVLNLP